MIKQLATESFGERERRILKTWEENNTFQKVVNLRKNSPQFSSYDGPPFATGLPHYGHFLAGTIKDAILRYQTMRGFSVPRRNGWDCHGLPIENEVEKTLSISGADSIEEYGIAKFNEKCREIVLRYTGEWKQQMERMGRWVDFSNTWKTMDLPFMESVWWVFKQLFDKGLVYKGHKVMPYSWKLGTPLSNFEAGENYKEVDDPSLSVSISLADDPEANLLVWTTTPWTLVSNLAVLVGPEIVYVRVRDGVSGKVYILAKERLSAYYKKKSEYAVIETFKGKHLVGERYEPLFPYFADRADRGAFQILAEESVSVEEGTGLVHAAPAFGEVDFFACEKAGIDWVCPVDKNGAFTEEVAEYKGLFVKEADQPIIRSLKQAGRVVRHTTCRHRYPFCWRSDTPLIYRVVGTWFVAVERLRENLLKNNQKIDWTPSHLKEGRFGKWLEGARDWAISRSRYWGTPIPLWESEEGEVVAVGSCKELEALTGERVTDLHRHFIDQLTFERGGKLFKKIPEVFDCWFESGSMPYAQNHYPFENKEIVEQTFPADFIAEGLDQTRGWFYTLLVLSTALFDQPPFRHVIVNGIILAEDGAKMSKRLKNYPDPMRVVEKYGADAVRLYMLHSGAVKADDLRFCERGVELVLRQILLPFWNAYSFFVTYANIYHWKVSELSVGKKSTIDQWILSLSEKLAKEIQDGMDGYDLSAAVEPLVGFIDQLTNWYIRRSRRRFWAEEATPDRNEAFSTLYLVLIQFVKVAAPFIPFLAEAVYLNLRGEKDPESVHLCDFPKVEAVSRNVHLEQAMASVQRAVSLGHALRKAHKIKVRQPLRSAHIASSNKKVLSFLQEQSCLIEEELNVKSITFTEEERALVLRKARPNFRRLGKRLGKQMRPVQQALEELSQSSLEQLEMGALSLKVGEEEWLFTKEDVEVVRTVKEGVVALNEGEITVALETDLTESLLLEGIAREIVNKVNTMRREQGFQVSDRIHLTLSTTRRVRCAFETHSSYIQEEVLATDVHFAPCEGEVWELNGEPAQIWLQKAL